MGFQRTNYWNTQRYNSTRCFGLRIVEYEANIAGANEAALNASVIGVPFLDFMGTRTSWTGTASLLLAELTAATDERTTSHPTWKDLKPNEVSNQLRRIAPNLRRVDLDITFDGKRRGITVCTAKYPREINHVYKRVG